MKDEIIKILNQLDEKSLHALFLIASSYNGEKLESCFPNESVPWYDRHIRGENIEFIRNNRRYYRIKPKEGK